MWEAGYALQTFKTGVTVAAGAVTGGVGAVALRIAVHAGKTAGKLVVKISRARRAAGRRTPNEGSLDLDEKKVVDFGKTHDGYGDDQGGHPVRPADREPGGPGFRRRPVPRSEVEGEGRRRAQRLSTR